MCLVLIVTVKSYRHNACSEIIVLFMIFAFETFKLILYMLLVNLKSFFVAAYNLDIF